MAYESYICQHFVDFVYFLQLKLFLRFSQNLNVVGHFLVTCRLGFLPAEAGYLAVCNVKASYMKPCCLNPSRLNVFIDSYNDLCYL